MFMSSSVFQLLRRSSGFLMKIFVASENLRGILRCKTSASIPSVPNPLPASSLIINLGEVMMVMARAPQEADEVEAVRN